MFWTKKVEAAQAARGPQKIEMPEYDKSFADQYDALAKSVGVKVRMKSTLKDVLQEENIRIFDLAEVERYMDKKGHWSWFPLRDQDVCKTNGFRWDINRETRTDYDALYGAQNNTQYDKEIPYPVLLTVKTIVDRMGDDVLFLVAAPDKHPDPFLGVMQRSNWLRPIVVERWDEPSFRG